MSKYVDVKNVIEYDYIIAEMIYNCPKVVRDVEKHLFWLRFPSNVLLGIDRCLAIYTGERE